MKLIWLGHGSFRLETENGVLLLDPWLTGNPVLPEDSHDAAVEGANHILMTHAHFDHSADAVQLARKLGVPVVGQYDVMSWWADAEGIETIGFNKGGTVDLNGTKVSMVRAEHSSTFGSLGAASWPSADASGSGRPKSSGNVPMSQSAVAAPWGPNA